MDDGLRLAVRAGSEIKEACFEERDAAQAPGGVGELLDQEGLGGIGRLIFALKVAAVLFVGGGIFGRQDGRLGAQAVAERVARGSLFTGIGDGAGGVLGVFAIDGGAAGGVAIDGGGVGDGIGVIELDCWCYCHGWVPRPWDSTWRQAWNAWMGENCWRGRGSIGEKL